MYEVLARGDGRYIGDVLFMFNHNVIWELVLLRRLSNG